MPVDKSYDGKFISEVSTALLPSSFKKTFAYHKQQPTDEHEKEAEKTTEHDEEDDEENQLKFMFEVDDDNDNSADAVKKDNL